MLVVAPYNAQVARLRVALPDGARVGTVDRFQGREAPVVIYSMASSSAADAPRGVAFLYDLNRLNVAVSRARAMSIVVASPALLDAEVHTPGAAAGRQRAVPLRRRGCAPQRTLTDWVCPSRSGGAGPHRPERVPRAVARGASNGEAIFHGRGDPTVAPRHDRAGSTQNSLPDGSA